MARSLYCLRCCPWVSSAFLWCTSSPRFLPPMKTFGVEPVSSSLCSRPRLVPGSPRSWCCCSPYLLLLFGGVCAPGSMHMLGEIGRASVGKGCRGGGGREGAGGRRRRGGRGR